MRKILTLASLLVFSITTNAQIVFDKLEFVKEKSWFGGPQRKTTDIKFHVTSDKTIKYIDLEYYAINSVGDALYSSLNGQRTGKYKIQKIHETGPFTMKQKVSKNVSGVGTGSFYSSVDIVAFPSLIRLTYVDDAIDSIIISKENISTFFPKIEWRNVNNKNEDITESEINNIHVKIDIPEIENLHLNDSTGEASFIIESNLPKDKLYKACRMWLAEHVKNYNNIKQLEDPEEGMLIVNYSTNLFCQGNDENGRHLTWQGIQTWKMTIQCKENKYRVKLTEYNSSWKQEVLFGMTYRLLTSHSDQNYVFSNGIIPSILFAKQYRDNINKIGHSIKEYVEKSVDDNF